VKRKFRSTNDGKGDEVSEPACRQAGGWRSGEFQMKLVESTLAHSWEQLLCGCSTSSAVELNDALLVRLFVHLKPSNK